MDYIKDLNCALRRLQDIELVLNESCIVAFTDNKGVIEFVNDKFCEISQYSAEELVGSTQKIVNSNYHSKEFFNNMWRTISSGHIWRGEIKNKAKDGSYYWVDSVIFPFLDENGEPYQYIAIRHDITKLKEQEAILKQKAYFHDPLTSLKNRHWLNKWIRKQKSGDQTYYNALFLDVDYFKAVNDNFGHFAGDIVLKEVATRINDCVTDEDFVIRQGGDEFVIFLNHSKKDKKKVINTVERLKERLSQPFYVSGKQIFLTVSIGIAMNTVDKAKNNNIEVIEKTMQEADTALFHAKMKYGNSHVFNTTEQNKQMKRYYKIVPKLKQALANNEFHLVYQPIINIKTEQIEGVEALLRWENPKLGNIPPIEFIPLLEELGLIIKVGDWIIQSVCKQMHAWHKKGILIERAAINVSPLQFASDHFVDNVQKHIQTYELNPACIELEITENILMNLTEAEHTLKELRNLGVTISIDDFGTGYSSLSYLTRLPINTLKIDKSFIHRLNDNDDIIVNTIITMGRNLNFKVLAEGVESKEQIKYLLAQNCHEGQGYFWSKPISEIDIEQIYKDNMEQFSLL